MPFSTAASASTTTTTARGSSSSTTNDNDLLAQILRGGSIPQTSLLAAAQQFAAAAAAAQQFAAAAAMAQESGQQQSPFLTPTKAAGGGGKKSEPSSDGFPTPLRVPKAPRSAKPKARQKGKVKQEAGESLSLNTSQTQPQTQALSLSSPLPRESEHSERKRPAAITELLQMKKARLGSGDGVMAVGVHQTEVGGGGGCDVKGGLSEILERICSGQEAEDTETNVSSSGSSGGASGKKAACGNGVNGASRRKQQPKEKEREKPAAVKISIGDEEEQCFFLSDSEVLEAVQQVFDSPNNAGGEDINSCPSTPTSTMRGGDQSLGTPAGAASTVNDVTESPFSCLVPHDRTFAIVPGRLSLLSNVVKYKMTVGEVKRRLMGPESFNFSLLGALLRRAKMPEKSQMLVDELGQVGLHIPRGRRRLSQVTLLSALTESESVQFARDFNRIAHNEFPTRQMAELVVRRRQEEGEGMGVEGVMGRLEQLESALGLGKEFVELLKQDRSPVVDMMPDAIFDGDVQDPLSQFSMLTHGFGTPALSVGMEMFLSFVQHQIRALRAQAGLPTVAASAGGTE